MLIVHHLQVAQSERIVWLCEELGIEYELKTYERGAGGRAPPELAKFTPIGSAPVIQDGDVTLAESDAIANYILARYGGGKLVVVPNAPNFADYLYWFHFANGSMQGAIMRTMLVNRLASDPNSPSFFFVKKGFEGGLTSLNNRLSKSTWLAGEEFTAADIMNVFSVTTMRMWVPFSLEAYPGIVAWLKRVGERPGYRRAMEKGDPGLKPALGAAAPEALRPKV